jgi:hypothetical protein
MEFLLSTPFENLYIQAESINTLSISVPLPISAVRETFLIAWKIFPCRGAAPGSELVRKISQLKSENNNKRASAARGAHIITMIGASAMLIGIPGHQANATDALLIIIIFLSFHADRQRLYLRARESLGAC